MRLIDADALLEKRRSFYEPRELESSTPIASTCVTVDDIYRAPTIDAAPVVHARWVDECDGYRTCSECGCEHPIRDARGYLVDDEYCPACGAKMDGGAKDDV